MGHRQNLPKTASVANYESDGRLNAPSAVRNAEPIVELVKKTVIKSGNALEIASGTGQHVVKLASALPHLNWQPSDVDEARIKSIRCWSDDQHLTNLKPPCLLDATTEGWAAEHHGQDFILLVNLLHLISTKETKILVKENEILLSKLEISMSVFLICKSLFSSFDDDSISSLVNCPEIIGL